MTDSQYALAKSALDTLAQRQYAEPGSVTNALTQLSEHFPVVAPGGTTNCAIIPDGFQALVTYVVAEPPSGPQAHDGDVFKHKGTNSWCFKHAFLKKLAAGIGLEWIEEKRLDTFQHPFVCSILVRGRYRDYSGEWRYISGSTTLDLRDEAEHGMKPNQLRTARGKIHSLCASFAKSRAIADACVSRTIDENDLGKPIVMAKLFRTSAVDDRAAPEAAAALYGDEPEQGDAVHGEIVDRAPDNVRTAQPAPGGVVPAQLPGGGKALIDLTEAEIEACRSRVQDMLDSGALNADQEQKARSFMDALIGEMEMRLANDAGGDVF